MGKKSLGNRRPGVKRCQRCSSVVMVLHVLEHVCEDCGGKTSESVCDACSIKHAELCPLGLWPIHWAGHHPTYRN